MQAARCAGSNDAIKASISTNAAARVRTSGSKGLTPNRNDCSRCDAAVAHTSPRAQPTAASLAAEVKISFKIPDRCEPNAKRMAISWVRRAAEKDKADYFLLLQHGGGVGNRWAVSQKDGSVIASGESVKLGNSVKDACLAMGKGLATAPAGGWAIEDD